MWVQTFYLLVFRESENRSLWCFRFIDHINVSFCRVWLYFITRWNRLGIHHFSSPTHRPVYVFNVRRFCRASLPLICISTAAEADSCQGFGLHGDKYNRVTGGPGATKKFERGKNAVKRKERESDRKQKTQTDRVLQYQYYKLLQYQCHRMLFYKDTQPQTDTVLQYCSISTTEYEIWDKITSQFNKPRLLCHTDFPTAVSVLQLL